MSLKVYFDLLSQPSRAVLLFLKCNNIPHVECPVALRKGEHFSEEFTKVNPLQAVPCIDDNGFKLTESVVILKYLAIKNKTPDHWYPNDFIKQIRVDEYMNWQHLNLRMNGGMYFRQRVILKPLDKEKLEDWKENLDKCLSRLENVYLSKGPFINGANDITVGDLLCICELEQPLAAGYDLLTNRPKLREYMERVKSKLAPHYEPVNKVVQQLSDAVKKGKV